MSKPTNKITMNFKGLIHTLLGINDTLQKESLKAVNLSLTLRNWYFGLYIFEFEQNGNDRAEYGKKLLAKISKEMSFLKITNTGERELRRYRQFYLAYHQIGKYFSNDKKIRGLSKPEFRIIHSISKQISIRGSANPEFKVPEKHYIDLLQSVSYSHLKELIRIGDGIKRLYYEIECMKSGWSVVELKRQIGSLLYERTGLSKNKKLVLNKIKQSKKKQWKDSIKDPYIFEFLGLKQKEVFTEKVLEQGLIDNLQNFLLELGKGFCFEARQQRIKIDNEHYFVDLVFYHRILHCNVLIEIKTEKFHHSHASQLNLYLEYYKKYEMEDGDNPPVGILFCTDKEQEHVEFSLAGIEDKVFISNYLVSLPDIKDLKSFIKSEMKRFSKSKS